MCIYIYLKVSSIYSPYLGAILSVSSQDHQSQPGCIHLFDQSLTQIHMKVSDQQNHMKALEKPPVQLKPKKEIEKYLLDFYHPHVFEIP